MCVCVVVHLLASLYVFSMFFFVGFVNITMHHNTIHQQNKKQTHEDKWYQCSCEKMSRNLYHTFPVLLWLRYYDNKDLSYDIIAGISIGAMILPQAIAYASIAGVSSDVGLYTALFGLAVYPFFGTARHLTIGAASIAAILV